MKDSIVYLVPLGVTDNVNILSDLLKKITCYVRSVVTIQKNCCHFQLNFQLISSLYAILYEAKLLSMLPFTFYSGTMVAQW